MKIVIDIPEEIYKECVSVNVGKGHGKTIIFHLKDKTAVQTMIDAFVSMIKPTQEKIDCDDCIYCDITNWDQDPRTGKAKPELWCKKHRHFCSDIIDCEYYTEDDEYDSN